MRPIGIYSGTFDPIHDGHVAFALGAVEVCGLDKVVFLPEASPRGKHGVAPLATRLAAIKARIDTAPALEALSLDEARFTVADTLSKLQALFPDSELTLLIGSDVAEYLDSWPKIGTLIDTVSFAIGLRQGADKTHLAKSLDALGARYRFVETAMAHLSSSMYR